MKISKIFGLLFFLTSFEARSENYIKTLTVDPSGFSAVSADLLTLYAGLAGTTTCAGDSTTTCNSCTDTTGAVEACNQKSIYPTLKVTISFTVTKALASAPVKLVVESASVPGQFNDIAGVTGATVVTAAGADQSFSLQTTWGNICTAMGAPLQSDCSLLPVAPATTLVTFAATKGLGVHLDGDANGFDADERSVKSVKLHIIPPGLAAALNVQSQSYCASQADTANHAGICNLSFLPGDQKVYIDQKVYQSADTTSGLDWDSVVLFPIQVSAVTEPTVFSTFTNGKVAPVIKAIVAADGSLPDSLVGGSLKNYQRYCFVYGNKNQAQNIYRFVTTSVVGGCTTPSEVVGLLNDNHCFISTAAFGSEMAPEVSVFRQFRNEFLINNYLGRKLVKSYYFLSPPLANVISRSELLKSITRTFLYPLLGFSYVALHYGILVALLTFVMSFILVLQISKVVFYNKKFFLVAVLLMGINLKAEVESLEKTIQHPGASEGLVRIRKDGSYVYDVKYEMKHQSSHLSLGQAQPPNISVSIQTTDTNGNPTGTNQFHFEDFYSGASKLIINYDYEWYPWIDKGMLGLQLGGSFMYADGHGRLVLTPVGQPNPSSVEKFSFLTLPLNFGAIYRLQWNSTQKFAPYVAGGGTYVLLAEKREDKSTIHYTGGLGFYGAGGILINLSAFNSETTFELNNEYGIGNLWFSLEYKITEVNNAAFSLSSRAVNGGVSFDF